MFDYKAFFKKHPVFHVDELKAHIKEHGLLILTKTCNQMLYYHCRKNTLQRIRKGLYAVNNEFDVTRREVSPFVVAGKVVKDAIIAYHTALESHQVAYTHFNTHVFLAKRSKLEFEFEGQYYSSVRDPLFKANKEISVFGVEPIVVDGVTIKQTNLSRTIVDVLDRPDLSGGWEEVWRSLDNVTSFNAELCVKYAIKLGKGSIVAKLGYFFDQRPAHLPVDKSTIEQLMPYIPKQLYYVDRTLLKEQRVYIKKWSLVVPSYLHNRGWEEPDYDANI